MTRTIRRYGNRKLYDITESRYVTLAFLGDRIRAGDEVVVTTHPGGQDITSETLANIILAEVHGGREYDRPRLVELIRASRANPNPTPPAPTTPPTMP